MTGISEPQDQRGQRYRLLVSAATCANLLASRSYGNLSSDRFLSESEIAEVVGSIGQPIVPTPNWEIDALTFTEEPSQPVDQGPTATRSKEVLQREAADLTAARLDRKAEDFSVEVDRLIEQAVAMDSPDRMFETVVPIWTKVGRCGLGMRVRIAWSDQLQDVIMRDTLVEFSPVDPNGAPPTPAGAPPLLTWDELTEQQMELAENPVPVRWRPALTEVVHRMVSEDFEAMLAEGIIPTPEIAQKAAGVTSDSYIVDLPEEAWRYANHDVAADHPGKVVLNLWSEIDGYAFVHMHAYVNDDGTSPITVEIEDVQNY